MYPNLRAKNKHSTSMTACTYLKNNGNKIINSIIYSLWVGFIVCIKRGRIYFDLAYCLTPGLNEFRKVPYFPPGTFIAPTVTDFRAMNNEMTNTMMSDIVKWWIPQESCSS